jgi:hypothetical protein
MTREDKDDDLMAPGRITVVEQLAAAFRAGFRAGFSVSREGFNGGCRYDHCAPGPFWHSDDALQAAEDAAVKAMENPPNVQRGDAVQITPEARRRGFLELADDLDRWMRACRDTYSDVRDPDLAEALETLSRRVRAAADLREDQ